MIMFTPMNGRRAFERIRRRAEDEWMNEMNVFDKLDESEAQKILLDSIQFYLIYIQNRSSNISHVCHNGQKLLHGHSENSLHWRVTIEHIFNGLFKLAKDPTFCSLM